MKVPSVQTLPNRLTGFTVSTKTHRTESAVKTNFSFFQPFKTETHLTCLHLMVLMSLFYHYLQYTAAVVLTGPFEHRTSRKPLVADFTS